MTMPWRAERPERGQTSPAWPEVAAVAARADVRGEHVRSYSGVCRYLDRAGEAVLESAPRDGVDGVHLVQDELDRQLVGSDVCDHRVDGGDHLVQSILADGRVRDV